MDAEKRVAVALQGPVGVYLAECGKGSAPGPRLTEMVVSEAVCTALRVRWLCDRMSNDDASGSASKS